MERHIEERFERIERNLETVSQINQDTATLARENQKRLDQLMAKMDEFSEVQRKSVSNHRVTPYFVSTPIARKVGKRVENACVSYRHIEGGRYELDSDGGPPRREYLRLSRVHCTRPGCRPPSRKRNRPRGLLRTGRGGPARIR